MVINTVFLLGTGISEGSWLPVMAAIDEVAGTGTVGHDVRAANFFFASLVHRRRHCQSMIDLPRSEMEARFGKDSAKLKRIKSRIKTLRATGAELRKRDLRLKRAIAKHLMAATKSGVMRLRDKFREVARQKRFAGSVAFLTTNWDMLLEGGLRAGGDSNPRVGHLHGSIEDDPSRLLLPSETVEERYHSPEDRKEVGDAKMSRWKFFNVAKTIVVYGLSFSPLDAELGLTLSMGLENAKVKRGQIIVMNVAGEVDRIARRMRMLTLATNWSVTTEVVG
jgi:hypothetical protein